jgi:hypothetical protein
MLNDFSFNFKNKKLLARKNNKSKKHTKGWSSMITPQGLTWRCEMGAIHPSI